MTVAAASCAAWAAASDLAQANAANAILPQDLSPIAMFMAADSLVKAVMIGLALASVLTWTVLIAKTQELARVRSAQKSALGALDQAHGLLDAESKTGASEDVTARLLRAAVAEVRLSSDALHDAEGVKERVASRLEGEAAAASRKLIVGTGLLATIGATAPFVGLFGTVWGIMNSFIGIAKSQTTNLAVVAPGIAEALLATALGLVAAIPAVVIYNHLTRQIAGHKAGIYEISSAILRLVSRDLSRGALQQTIGSHRAPLTAAE